MPEYVTAESDGFTVSSNTATEEAIHANLTPAVEDAPVETETPEAPADESEATKAAKTLAAQKKKGDPSKDPAAKKASIQAQIDAETKRKYEAKREADAETARLEALRQERAALEQPPVSKEADPSKPKRDAFISQIGTTYASYEEANDAYDDARDAWREQTAADRARASAAQSFQQNAAQKAQERIDAFKADHPDYDEVVGKAFIPQGSPSAEAVVEHLRHSELGPQLAYHLGNDLPALARIAALPYGFAIAALGRLEEKLDNLQDTAASTTGPAATPPRTNAKPPFKPVGGSPVASDDGEVPDDLPFDEYVKRMNALDAKAARRR